MLLNFVCLNKLDFAHVSIELVDPPSVRFSACWPALLCSPRNLSVKWRMCEHLYKHLPRSCREKRRKIQFSSKITSLWDVLWKREHDACVLQKAWSFAGFCCICMLFLHVRCLSSVMIFFFRTRNIRYSYVPCQGRWCKIFGLRAPFIDGRCILKVFAEHLSGEDERGFFFWAPFLCTNNRLVTKKETEISLLSL